MATLTGYYLLHAIMNYVRHLYDVGGHNNVNFQVQRCKWMETEVMVMLSNHLCTALKSNT